MNYPICLNYKKNRILRGECKKEINFIDILRYRLGEICSSDSALFRAFIMYFVCGGFQLSNPVGGLSLLIRC